MARHAELPDRPNCPRCGVKIAMFPRNTKLGVGSHVIVTHGCQHRIRRTTSAETWDGDRRCGQAYAVVCSYGREAKYVFADDFEQLDLLILAIVRQLKDEAA